MITLVGDLSSVTMKQIGPAIAPSAIAGVISFPTWGRPSGRDFYFNPTCVGSIREGGNFAGQSS